jgi:hypothetical protein
MVLPQALEYNWEFNRSLEQIGEQARQQRAYQQKLEQDNRQKQLQVLQEINPATLYPKFEREVVDQTIGELTAGMANYMKQNPNASYIDLQNMVNQNLGKVAQWSAKVKSIKENIDKSVSLRDAKEPYDRGRMRALAIDKALYKTDESGRKVMKGADEIDLETDILSQVIEENEDKLIDPFKGEQAMNDKVKDASLYTKSVQKTIETPDGRKTNVFEQKSSVPFFLEAKDGDLRVKQQNNGYIDESVFQQFYQDPAIRANVNANAKSNMKKIGVPDSPEANEYFKRAYLTTWLEGNKKGVIDMVDKTLYQKPVTTSGSDKTPDDQAYINAYQKIDALTSSKKKGFGTPFNELDLETQGVVLAMVKPSLGGATVGQADIFIKKEADGTNAVYTYNALKDVDGNVIRKANDRIGALTTTGVNLAANKGGGVKTKKAIIQQKPQKYIVGGKEYSNEDLIGMGYTQAQIESAIKAGTVKIK